VSPKRLKKLFFDGHHVDVAKTLVGCTLVWDDVQGTIVETEGYGAEDDPACHTWSQRPAMKFFQGHSPGTVYAYISNRNG
jgi:3-methyladenine DNA glycosylase Mpg